MKVHCFNFSADSPDTAASSSQKKGKKKTDDTHAAPPHFMDGSSTSTSSFELDAFDDRAIEVYTPTVMTDESILASSNQHSTLDLPNSPLYMLKSSMLATSTPKDLKPVQQVEISRECDDVVPQKREYSEWCANRRESYRCQKTQKIRNMQAPIRPPGFENHVTSYYPREYIAKLEEQRRQELSFEGRIKKQREETHRENIELLRNNLVELALSFFVFVWQFLFFYDVIPNDITFFYVFHLLLNSVYAGMYIVRWISWCGVIGSGFLLYMLGGFLIGTSLNVEVFLFTAVLLRAAAAVFQTFYLLLE